MASSLNLILTRPAQEAPKWLEGLVSGGHQVVNWPLIEISPIARVELIKSNPQTIRCINSYSALVFVSSAAVEHFFQALTTETGQVQHIQPHVLCWATGPGTALALKRQGLSAQQIVSPLANAPQFDSPQLWEVTKDLVSAGQKVLFIRGLNQLGEKKITDWPPRSSESVSEDDTSDSESGNEIGSEIGSESGSGSGSGSQWLMYQLRQKGVQVDELAVYLRGLPKWSEEQKQKAILTLNQGSIWIFSSSLSVHNLGRLLPTQDWSKCRALTTHNRIAQSALEMGWGVVHASRPTISDVVMSLKYFN